MAWLLILLAFAALAVAFKTTSVMLLTISLLAALVLMVIGVLKLLADRVDSRSRSESMMIDPVELHRLREQAEARRQSAAQSEGPL